MRRFVLLIAFVFGFVSLAVPASASASATKVTLTVSSGTAAPKKAFHVTGHVLPAAVRPLALQALVGAKWKTVGTGKSSKRGAFSLIVTPAVVGAMKLRVETLSGKLVLATSAVFTLYVRTATTVSAGFTYPTSVQGFAAPLQGAVSPNEAGRVVGLQQLVAGKWVQVAATTSAAGGFFAFDAPTKTQGQLSFRVAVAASAKRSAAVGVVLALPVAAPLDPLAVQLSDGNHATVQELGGAKRTLDLPMADKDLDLAAMNGRIASLTGEQGSPQTLRVTGPSLAPVVVVHVLAPACVYTFDMSAEGHAITWTIGTLTAGVCKATAVFVRNIDAGVTSQLAVDAAAIASSPYVQVIFSFDESYVEVMTSPATQQVATYTSNSLFTLAGAPVRFAGLLDLGEYQLAGIAAPSGYLAAYDIAAGQYVTGSLTSGAAPVAVSELDLWLLIGSRDGTKIAYESPALDGLHLYTANADFSGRVDLGIVPDDSATSRTYVSWVSNLAVGVEVLSQSAANTPWTPATTVKSASDGTVLLTSTQFLNGWLHS